MNGCIFSALLLVFKTGHIVHLFFEENIKLPVNKRIILVG